MAYRQDAFAALLKEERDVFTGAWRSPSNLELALLEIDQVAVRDKPTAMTLLNDLTARVNAAYVEVFGQAFNPAESLKRGKTLREAHLPRLAQLCHFATRRLALQE